MCLELTIRGAIAAPTVYGPSTKPTPSGSDGNKGDSVRSSLSVSVLPAVPKHFKSLF
jgi:hypothetical protein